MTKRCHSEYSIKIPSGVSPHKVTKITDARSENKGDEVGWIDSPKTSYEIGFPARADISSSVRVVDAKSANQKKEYNCIS